VGKSHLLVGLGVRAIQLGFSVQYFRFDELLTALKVDAHLRPERLKKRKHMSSGHCQVAGITTLSPKGSSFRPSTRRHSRPKGGRRLLGRVARRWRRDDSGEGGRRR
jgi:hypothetical protein